MSKLWIVVVSYCSDLWGRRMINWHIVVRNSDRSISRLWKCDTPNLIECWRSIPHHQLWKLLDAPAPETGIYTYSRLSMFVVRAIITCLVNPSTTVQIKQKHTQSWEVIVGLVTGHNYKARSNTLVDYSNLNESSIINNEKSRKLYSRRFWKWKIENIHVFP